MNHGKRIVSVLLSLVLAFGCLSGAAAAAPATPQTLTDPDEVVTAIVLLEGAAVAQTAQPQRAAAGLRLARQHTGLRGAMRTGGISYTERFDYTTLLNGMAITVARKDLDRLAALEGVASVHIANRYDPPETVKMDSANEMTGAARLHESGYTGSGTVIAVLDTGITPQHEAFAVYEGKLERAALSEEDAQTAIETLGYGAYLSEKIPFSYDYADWDDDATDESSGHGTHVSAIAAGYAETDEGEVVFSGAAPDAQLLAMKVFPTGGLGTDSSIYFKALEDAYLLGADVVNLSLGSTSGFDYDASLEDEVFGNIYQTLRDNGVAVNVAAGNEGSMADGASNRAGTGYVTADYADYGTVGSPSTYAASLSVASAENASYPTHTLRAGEKDIAYNDATGSAFTVMLRQADSVEYAVVPGYGTEEDFAGLMVEGRIALVSRGELTFQEKAENAARAGAIALLVYNTDDEPLYMSVEGRELPAASITGSDGEALIALAQTVQPPEEELSDVRYLRTDSVYYDAPNVLVFEAAGVALSATEDGGVAPAPVSVQTETQIWDEDWEEEISYLTGIPDRLVFTASFEEDATRIIAADGSFLTAREDGTLYLSDEMTEYGAWDFDQQWDDETGMTLGCMLYSCGLGDEENRLFLKLQENGFVLAALDEDEYDACFFMPYRDETWTDEPVIPKVATDIGAISHGADQIEENPAAWQMSSFSSWGTTPDLQFKPQLTAIGGNVYAASFGTENGYELMSGTSMATPDLSGMMAALLQYLSERFPALEEKERMELAEAMLESSARLLTDEDGATFSPRRQGAGLADPEAATRIKAYITEPLLTLGQSEAGSFTLRFTVRSLGEAVSYRIDTEAMTDKLLALDGSLYNTLQSEALTAEDFTVSSGPAGGGLTVPAGGSVDVTLTLSLTDRARERLEADFPNGTFLEGYVTLTEGTALTAPMGEFRFDDVKDAKKFYYVPVYWAYEHSPQITAGTTATTFSPNRSVTRAQVVTFLWKAAGMPEPEATVSPFTDVADGKYYTKAVLWAAEKGIASGTSAGSFSPNKTCTRGEFVTFLYSFAGRPEVEETVNPFTDVAAGKFYAKPVLWAFANGVTAGTSATSFSPNKVCTRGEIVTFLYGYLGGSDGWEPAADGAAIHASYLGFVGDWTKAPILESFDWRDAIDAIQAADPYAGESYLDLFDGEVNTDVNTAYVLNRSLLESFGMLYGTYAGDNIQGTAAFHESHIAIAPGGVFDTLYLAPMLLRNARRVILTVSDAETDELLWATEEEYVIKSVYDPENGQWYSPVGFMYGGTGPDGNVLPNGSRLTVRLYASLACGEDVLGAVPYDALAAQGEDFCVWSFPLRIDTAVPNLDRISYDVTAQTLTVTASDNQFLAAIRLAQLNEEGEAIDLVGSEVFSDETESRPHTVVFENVEEGCYGLSLYDYAGNAVSAYVYPGEGEFVTVRLHYSDGVSSASGASTILATPGTDISLPGIAVYEENAKFVGWLTQPIDGEMTGEELAEAGLADALIPADEHYPVTGDADLYTVLQRGVTDPHRLLQENRSDLFGWEGIWAIGSADHSGGQNYFLQADAAATAQTTVPDEETGLLTLTGATDELLFELIEDTTPEGYIVYEIRSCENGRYLANDDGTLVFVDEVLPSALWNIRYDEWEESMAVFSDADSTMLFYDSAEGSFRLIDIEAYDPDVHSLMFCGAAPYDYIYQTR